LPKHLFVGGESPFAHSSVIASEAKQSQKNYHTKHYKIASGLCPRNDEHLPILAYQKHEN
jgi:hypothetical protein